MVAVPSSGSGEGRVRSRADWIDASTKPDLVTVPERPAASRPSATAPASQPGTAAPANPRPGGPRDGAAPDPER